MNVVNKECCSCCCDARVQCLQALQACLKKGGKYADATLCTTLLECAQLCQVCSDLCCTGSECCGAIAEACAKVCENGARCCDSMAEPELQKCAEALRKCAKACRAVCATVAC